MSDIDEFNRNHIRKAWHYAGHFPVDPCGVAKEVIRYALLGDKPTKLHHILIIVMDTWNLVPNLTKDCSFGCLREKVSACGTMDKVSIMIIEAPPQIIPRRLSTLFVNIRQYSTIFDLPTFYLILSFKLAPFGH